MTDSSGIKSLFFTTVLNTFEELDDGTSIEEQSYDRDHWNRKAKWVGEIADALLPLAAKHFESPSLRYLKQYIAVSSGSYNRMWLHKRTSPKALLNLKISPLLQDEGTALLDSAGIGYLKKPESFRVTVDRKAIESHAETFDKVIELVKRSSDERR